LEVEKSEPNLDPRGTRFALLNPVGEKSVPLLSHRIIGYDVRRMMFDFTMLTPDAMTVGCSISGSAMDRLIGKSGCLPTEREAQFSALRSKIEEIASSIYDLETPSYVYIFSKHVEVSIGIRGRGGKR
jgi:hypothetical protein